MSESDDLLHWAWTIICNAGEGDWTTESADWRGAAARFREEYHAYLRIRPQHYWHAYQTEVTEALEEQLSAVMAFTVIVDARKEAPEVHLGKVFGHELTFRYLCTWDHEPSELEREQAQLDQLAKEKEEQ